MKKRIIYDQKYFDGGKPGHPAGYTFYERTAGEDWWLMATRILLDKLPLKGKKVLEIGCAKGFLIQELRARGVKAYGIDVSEYAIAQAPDEVKKYIKIGKAPKALGKYKNNEWDYIISLKTLNLLTEKQVIQTIKKANRIAKAQYHLLNIYDEGWAEYGFMPEKEWWLAQDFKNTTVSFTDGIENFIEI